MLCAHGLQGCCGNHDLIGCFHGQAGELVHFFGIGLH
jgi:hypothetical protein